MVVTILAVVFLIIMILTAWAGYKFLGRQTSLPDEVPMSTCSICKNKFPTKEMVMRQIADYKLMYFCKKCILNLYSDLGLKN